MARRYSVDESTRRGMVQRVSLDLTGLGLHNCDGIFRHPTRHNPMPPTDSPASPLPRNPSAWNATNERSGMSCDSARVSIKSVDGVKPRSLRRGFPSCRSEKSRLVALQQSGFGCATDTPDLLRGWQLHAKPGRSCTGLRKAKDFRKLMGLDTGMKICQLFPII